VKKFSKNLLKKVNANAHAKLNLKSPKAGHKNPDVKQKSRTQLLLTNVTWGSKIFDQKAKKSLAYVRCVHSLTDFHMSTINNLNYFTKQMSVKLHFTTKVITLDPGSGQISNEKGRDGLSSLHDLVVAVNLSILQIKSKMKSNTQ